MYQSTLLDFLNMGGGEMMMILVAVLLLFGGKKLPELARGLGKGIREFKDASEGVKREIHRNINSVTNEEELKKEDENHALRHHPVEEEVAVVDPYSTPIDQIDLEQDQSSIPKEEEKIKVENKSNETHS
jgi:sec-independent protein translocase protein TatA